MDIESQYQKIIAELKLGHRALVRFGDDEIDQLIHLIDEKHLQKDHELLEKALCLLEHSAGLVPKTEPILLKILNTDLPDPLIIFALNCARRHIIQSAFQRGNRLKFDLLETLKKLLFSTSPEVVEWTLRTIEECGNQGVYFLREFDKIKPAPWKWFNAHQRAVREIIAMLERRWGRFEKPGS